MVKVITYGTYDLLHFGHIKLLQRAKKLGDYLIVGVTSDDYDRTRGKINIQQSLAERINAVKDTGLADEIIVEEYEGQKIDDIKRYNIDIFTVGSDWEGKFDYLNEYCKVIYLERTKGISSSEIRSQAKKVTMGLIGDNYTFLSKIKNEDKYVNGIEITSICSTNTDLLPEPLNKLELITSNYDELLNNVDSIFIDTREEKHYDQIKLALKKGISILCESPITLSKNECKELYQIAQENNAILMDGIKTAYSTAYSRMLLLIKAGKIGNVISIDVNCTSLTNNNNSLYGWGGYAMLPIFQILGTDYIEKNIISHFTDSEKKLDSFTKIDFLYKNAVASLKVAEGAKTEGELIITGTKGYLYIPAPWWKTDYFEIRYENIEENKRYFYQLDGEGIRYELVAFIRAIKDKNFEKYISKDISLKICEVIEDFNNKKDLKEI